MGGISSGYRGDRKPRIEHAICLDLGHPRLREALNTTLWATSGTVDFTGSGIPARSTRLGLAISPQQGSTRNLVIRFDPHDPAAPRQILPLELTQFGFDRRWVARCDCGRRARKLYLAEGPKLACWRCCELQYSTAARHDARLDALRGDLQALEAAAGNYLKRPILAGRACELGMKTLQRGQKDLQSRSPRRRRAAAALIAPEMHSC